MSGEPQALLHRNSFTFLWQRGGQAAGDKPRQRRLDDSTVGRSGDPAKEAHPQCTVTSARRKKPTPTYLLTSKYILKTNRAFY